MDNLDACPACTASLIRNGKVHCAAPGCNWLTCGTCGTTIDVDQSCYYGQGIWGNPDGYLKET